MLETLVPSLSPDAHVLIAGPTASGKTALALAIAAQQGGLIVNADALQIYDCWRVISARPSAAEEAQAPHALYGTIGPYDSWSVGHWLRAVADLKDQGQRLIIVGGTGLYFTALSEGLAEVPPVPPEVRAEADLLLAEEGLDAMIAGLDAPTAARIDLLNPARVQRAWEVLRATGRGLAGWQADTPAPLMPLAHVQPLVLMPDRDWLAARIDRRFLMMMDQGALDEARAALDWWDPRLPAAQAIGAPELVAHLRGEMDLDTAIAASQAASRQYAKRQRTWFRNRMKMWRRIDLPTTS